MNDGLKAILLEVMKSQNLISEMNYAQIRAELDTQYSTNQVSRHAHFTDLLKELGGFPNFQGVGIKKIDATGDMVLIAEYDFNYINSKNKNVNYSVTIQFKDFNQIIDNLEETLRVKVKKLFQGELGLHCSCPSFKYRYNYVANSKGSGIKSEVRPASETNPNDIGIGCKHIALCMEKQVFKFISNDVYNSLNKWYTEAKKEAMAKDPNLKQVVKKEKSANPNDTEEVDDGNSDTKL